MSASQRFLAIYSGVLTLAFGAIVLTGAASTDKASFDTIDVQRINVREPDGTLRMVISSKDRFPGAIFGDKEYPHPRGVAGMIFYNDEGIETGGLIFSGRGADGEVESGVHLSFDPYDRDQTVQLTERNRGDTELAALMFRDKGETSARSFFESMERIRQLPEDQQESAKQELIARGSPIGAKRLIVGKVEGQRAVVDLRDSDGNSRLSLVVTPDGQASIEFRDAEGKVTGTITPETLKQ